MEAFNWLREQLGDNWEQLLAEDAPPAAQRPAPRPRQNRPQQQSGGVMMFPSIVQFGAAAAAGGAANQANTLQGMIDQTTGAIARENQSRVSQMREYYRMMQDQQMKGMDIQALLIRLRHEREMAEKRMKYEAGMQRMRDDKARGVKFSTRWNRLFD